MIRKITALFLLLLLISCNKDNKDAAKDSQEQAAKVYYKGPNGKIVDEKTFNDYKSNFIKNNKKSDSSIVSIEEKITNETRIKDSIIKEFKFDIQIFSSKSEQQAYLKTRTFIGKDILNHTLETVGGKEVVLSQYKGKPMIINFWFTSCPPCIQEMPALNALKDKFKDKAVFLGVTFNDAKQVDAFLKKHPFNYDIMVNAKPFIKELEMERYPQTFFVDKKVLIVDIKEFIAEDDTEIELLITSLL